MATRAMTWRARRRHERHAIGQGLHAVMIRRGTCAAVQSEGAASFAFTSAVAALVALRQDRHKATAAHSSRLPAMTEGTAIGQIPAALLPVSENPRKTRPQVDISKPITPTMIEAMAFTPVLPIGHAAFFGAP